MYCRQLIKWVGMNCEEEVLDNYRHEALHLTTPQEVWKASNVRVTNNKDRFSLSHLPLVSQPIVQSFKCHERLDRALQAR